MQKRLFKQFLEIVTEHGISAMRLGFQSTPLQTKELEYRLLRDLFMKKAIAESIPEIKVVSGESYDLIFKDEIRISLKMQEKAFQKKKTNGELTVPPLLQMHNFQTRSSDRSKIYKPSEHCDVIWVCQPRKHNQQDILGILPSRIADEYVITGRKDQGQIRVPNFVYESNGLFIRDDGYLQDYDLTEVSNIFSEYLNELAQKLIKKAIEVDLIYQGLK